MDELTAQPESLAGESESGTITVQQRCGEVVLLTLLFFVYAGDLPPMVNEAHYLVKAKNFWQPDWCQNDLFASSGKAHMTFYVLFGWMTKYVSLEATAWIGRTVGWAMLAIGLQRLCWNIFQRRFTCLAVAVVWIAGIEHGNLAGEWVVGGIEAKVPAYGLVLMVLAALVIRRWNQVWILLGAAAAFHVLSGGWAVIAALFAWFFTERSRKDGRPLLTPALFAGGAISVFGLAPAIALTMGATAADSTIAARIYTYFRIPHHLLPADFFAAWYLRHGELILLTMTTLCFYWRQNDRIQRLGWFTIGAMAIAGGGLVVGMLPSVAPDLAAKLLRYYWFRLSDAVLPLLFAVVVTQMALDPSRLVKLIAVTMLLVGIILVAHSSYRRSLTGVPPSVSNELLGRDAGAPAEVQQQVFRDWLAVCRWARTSTGKDEVFLTPRHQQTFKWYSERAEVVNWKDVPQDAASLREWYRRFQEVFPRKLGSIRVSIEYPTLWRFRREYGVRYMIVDRRVTGKNLPLVKLYPTEHESNDHFAVYELPTQR